MFDGFTFLTFRHLIIHPFGNNYFIVLPIERLSVWLIDFSTVSTFGRLAFQFFDSFPEKLT